MYYYIFYVGANVMLGLYFGCSFGAETVPSLKNDLIQVE